MAEQFANERKSTPKIVKCPDLVKMSFLSLANRSAIQDLKCVGKNECFGVRAILRTLLVNLDCPRKFSFPKLISHCLINFEPVTYNSNIKRAPIDETYVKCNVPI